MDRVKNVTELEQIIAGVLSQLPRESAIEMLSRAGIACGRISNLDDLIAHPQRRLIAVSTGGGEIEMLAPGAKFVAEAETYGPVPKLGQHTEALKREFARRVASHL